MWCHFLPLQRLEHAAAAAIQCPRQENDAWLRTTMYELEVTLTDGDISQGSQDIHDYSPRSSGLRLKQR